MKSIKALALIIALGLAGIVYAAGQAQEQDKPSNVKDHAAAASCCTAGANCCAQGGAQCCQSHHSADAATKHTIPAAPASIANHETMSCGADGASCCSSGASCCGDGCASCRAAHEKGEAAAPAHGRGIDHAAAKASCCKAHEAGRHDVAGQASATSTGHGQSCCAGGASCCDGSSCCAAKSDTAQVIH